MLQAEIPLSCAGHSSLFWKRNTAVMVIVYTIVVEEKRSGVASGVAILPASGGLLSSASFLCVLEASGATEVENINRVAVSRIIDRTHTPPSPVLPLYPQLSPIETISSSPSCKHFYPSETVQLL